MPRRPGRITHVVQTIEECDQVEILFRICLGRRDLEASVCRHAVLPGVRCGRLDRVRMEVVAYELRLRECLRHQDGGPAGAAPDIATPGAALQLFDDTV